MACELLRTIVFVAVGGGFRLRVFDGEGKFRIMKAIFGFLVLGLSSVLAGEEMERWYNAEGEMVLVREKEVAAAEEKEAFKPVWVRREEAREEKESMRERYRQRQRRRRGIFVGGWGFGVWGRSYWVTRTYRCSTLACRPCR